MRRRDVLIAFTLASLTSAEAQKHGNSYRIAFVSPASPPEALTTTGLPHYRVLLEALHDLGYVEGQNLTVDRYSGQGRTSQYQELVETVVRSKPDLIFAPTSHLVRMFKAQTSAIPIVAYGADLVEEKLVTSLARPGGNVTGLAADTGPTFHGKPLEILSEALGRRLSRVGVLTSSERWREAAAYGAYRSFAEHAGVKLIAGVLAGYQEDEYRPAFEMMHSEQVEALLVGTEAENYSRRDLIVRLATEYALPAIYPDRIFVLSGGLISYGFDLPDNYRKLASVMDKILKGVSPSEIPVELPTKFQLALNLKAARALGLTIPPTLLTRADEVIE